jgi:O-antigen/teichoic acid export membrane protein
MSVTHDPSLSNTVRSTVKVFLGMVTGILLWFITKILIIRHFSKEELGLYSLSIAVVSIFSLLATLGLYEGIARFVSIFLGKNEKDRAESASRYSVNLSFLSGLCSFILLYMSSGMIANYIFYKPELASPLRIISFLIPFSVMMNIRIGILRGYNIIQAKIFAENGHPFFFLILLGFLLLFQFSFINVISAYVSAMGILFVFISIYCYKHTGIGLLSFRKTGVHKELMQFSLPLLAMSLMGVVLNLTDTLMLGRYATTEDVGVYNAGISLARLLIFPLTALVFVFMPLSGELYATGQMEELKRTYQVLTKWIFSATLPFFFILFFFPEMTLFYLFGERFIAASDALRILLLGFLLQSFMGANGLLMMVTGMSRALMHITLLETVLNVLLNYVLIKHVGLGIIGSSIAVLVYQISGNVIISLILFRKHCLHPFTPEYIKPVIASGVIGIILYTIAKQLPLHLWMMPLYFVLFIISYCLSLLFTRSLDREDMMIFEALSLKTGLEMQWIRNILLRFVCR